MIRILLYQPSVRNRLAFFLSETDGCLVVGSKNKAISIERRLCATRPDVILLDIAMKGAMELIPIIKECDSSVKILVLTDTSDLSKVILSLKKGANGYLIAKATPFPVLIESIKAVHEGGLPMNPSLMEEVLKELMLGSNVNPGSNKIDLTNREGEILQWLVNGLSYKEVALHLNISTNTVHSHIRRIFNKLEVTSKSQAILKAVKENVVYYK